jgi:hypothetical protein
MNPSPSALGAPTPSGAATSVPPHSGASGSSMMPVRMLFEYLIGRREAILGIASTPATLGVGALLVLSAALARNYDKPELLSEPWRLLGPFAASLAISGVLFLVVYGVASLRGMVRPGFVGAYRSFLALYWATAPLAWLYGIPFEHLFDPVDATRANLWTLGLVSVWRVAVMVRAISVLIGVSALAVFPVVMAVADASAWVALVSSPVPTRLIQLMGGTDPDPRAALVSEVALGVLLLGTVSFPVWLILSAWAARTWHPVWSVPEPQPARRAKRVFLFACASVAAWAMAAVAIR